MSNKFDIYSSKVKRVNIPIPGFKFFHKASSEEEVDPKFIGREQISDKLYSWLKDDPKGGSYLVTGFRGMGKSSFVGRVLNQLTQRTKPYEYFLGVVFFLSIIAIALGHNSPIVLIIALLGLFLSGLSVLYFIFQNIIKNNIKYRRFEHLMRKEAQTLEESGNYNNFKNWLEEKDNKIDWKRASHVLHREYNKNRSYKRICVNVNLGQEVLNEREVLSLISHKLYIKYREFVYSPIANFERWFIYIVLSVLISHPLRELYKVVNESLILFECFCEDFNTCIIYVDDLLKEIMFLLITFIALYLIAMRFSSSQMNILSRLRLLNQRLDAQVSFDERYGSKVDYASSILKAGFKKKRVYDIANVREIEQELIDVMDNISKGIPKLPIPSIVFVFDELDKVDSNSLSGTSGESQAEFSNEKNFPGGGTTRKRKQNVLHLLANMKLFVSTAKAKFIFISGRELYDAYLADLSDREFAVSSIFSGVIYVDSFCVNEHKGKDVMSNVETYICKQLIPNDYIERQFARYYAMQIVNGAAFERFDINLKLYYQYLVDVYKEKIGESFLKPFIEKDTYNEEDLKNYMCRSYIDKAVNLLYHFSVYLYHISNGSPKKMMLYFEKYVKKSYNKGQAFIRLEQDDFSSPNPDGEINILADSAPNYYLSFGYTDQRKIGFIHYLSYPVNQILVNANQYSDKLLVSVSFLVDHIYKFHNGGFSWRNLEYTPELLEVYKIPGFRSFINSIISYLQQTHLIAITCGLFQFKFRKQIAEEISLASKFSEEIAALFNFTLDESINVKQHYSEIRNTYLELEGRGDEQTPKHTPRLSIGLHNILGDLYMFDEEFNNAIFEYHAAIKELEKEMDEKKGDYPDLRNTLYSIQLLLKLGLANEKRNTNESALTVYSELVAKLIDFRHFDEKKLQLTYRLRKQLDWPSFEGVLVPLKYDYLRNLDFNEVHPRIVNDSDDLLQHTGMPFMASGPNLSTAFAHLLTPPKYAVMQRLSLFQDSRLIYQALLAKLFVKEKIGLGGITMTDIETIESEYNYLNLATNTSEKFLSSSDFFRRLGDILFYKNGLTVTFPNEEYGKGEDISFMNGLYYWGYDIKRELLDFCNVNNCYEHFVTLLSAFKEIKNLRVEKRISRESLDKVLYNLLLIIDRYKRMHGTECSSPLPNACKTLLSLYFEAKSPHIKLMKLIPTKEVIACNKHRQEMFRCNKPVPCFACNYYSRSMRILMRGMFNCELLEKRKNKNCSVFIIMEKLLVKGTSRSLRQDYVIQLAEILDCRANVLLSCATGNDNIISPAFLKDFLLFVENIDKIDPRNFNKCIKEDIDELDNKYGKRINKIEECIIYYWEASKCFSIANDLMKASASLKKILRVLQNYLKTSSNLEKEKGIARVNLVFDNMDKIKDAFVKPCLIHLYSHYNNINFAEIQKLKWVFSVQTYEDIPFNRLSLFPDVEQILLLYYDLLRRCAIGGYRLNICNKTNKMSLPLSKIYRNTTLGSIRQDSTIYERVMALRFKTLMNGDFLIRLGLSKDLYYHKKHEEGFVNFFLRYISSNADLAILLGEFRYCFRFALENERDNISKPGDGSGIRFKLTFLEFLIKDSLFCLTRILEIITPHTSSTLFSNSFYGEIYQMVYEWHMLFDELFLAYKYFENFPDANSVGHSTYKYLIRVFDGIDKNGRAYTMVEKFFKTKNKEQKEPLDSERFFNETTHEISKAQANYTFAKYSLAMAKESYERALQMHHEGKAYKDMISQMYYLDDDLKNDTIQLSSAIERYKINNNYIQEQLKKIQNIIGEAPMYEIDNYANENMNSQCLENRFYLQH